MSTATQAISGHETLEALLVKPGEEADFRANYNARPFLVHHKLCEHPALQPDRIFELAQSLSETHPSNVYYDVARKDLGGGWDYTQKRPFSLQEALQRIETSDSFIVLKGIQVRPEYARLRDVLLGEIHRVSRRKLDRNTRAHNITIVITSPNRLTPYHMDADCNFLLQLSGSKVMRIFDGSDRKVVTPQELESFYTGPINAAKYKEESEKTAWRFDLVPGVGVHIPVTYPHWVQNGNNVSISVGVNFHFVDTTVPDIHRMNHYLRKSGIHPRQPGESTISDETKKLMAKTLRTVMRKQHKS